MSNFEGVFKAAIKGMHDSNRKVYGPQLANVMKPGLEAMKPVFKLIYEKGLTDAIPEGCVVVPTTPSYEMWSGIARHLGRYMQMHDRYCPKTLKKYFDRFIGDIPEWLNEEVKDWDSDHAFATADLPAFIYMSMLEAARGGNE